MWIIPNNYQPSSASVLDTLESKEDLSLQGLNIESSLMWRSKPSPLRTWSQRWSRVTWFQHLSGRILKPSHLISFETQLTSSLEGIRASRLAWQEERKPLTIHDTSSPTSSTMSEQLDLLSASSRTSKDTSIRGLESVIQDLEGAGYDSTWGIFSAEEVGAPHQRKRIFILANSSSSGRQQISRSTHENESEHEGRSKVQTDITSGHGEGNRERSMANPNSSRQLQSQGSESEQWGWTRDSGQEGTVADPNSDDRRDRSRTLPRERWPWLEHRGSGERQLVRQPEEKLANTKSIGVQGLRTSGEQEPHSHGQEELSMRKSQAGGQANWLPEPNVGRVVDGCPDRVDRIRLLGNGVVPQTAARAWEVLNGRV